MKYTSFNDLETISTHLSAYQPKSIPVSSQRQASVALILRHGNPEIEILFIQRATSDQDPWSGQIAFPGGGKELEDVSSMAAATRETLEEVGIRLEPYANIGRLDDHQGRNNNRSLNLVISCFVFYVTEIPVLRPNYEVAEVFWKPLSYLIDPTKTFDYQTSFRDQPYPAIDLGVGQSGQDRILWGLTYRFVQNLLTIVT